MKQSENARELAKRLRQVSVMPIVGDTWTGTIRVTIQTFHEIMKLCGEAADHIEWTEDFIGPGGQFG